MFRLLTALTLSAALVGVLLAFPQWRTSAFNPNFQPHSTSRHQSPSAVHNRRARNARAHKSSQPAPTHVASPTPAPTTMLEQFTRVVETPNVKSNVRVYPTSTEVLVLTPAKSLAISPVMSPSSAQAAAAPAVQAPAAAAATTVPASVASDTPANGATTNTNSSMRATVGTAPAVVPQDTPRITTPVPAGRFSRFIDLQTVALATRYRFADNSLGITTGNNMQHQEALKGRFKFDKAGKYSVHAALVSGSSFTSSWNTTGIGTGQPVTNLYPKQFFFAAQPVKGFELQFGGLYINRGETSEIVSYDNDGFITGQRLTLKRPKNLYFDEVSITYGYLGDTNKPSIFRRLNRFNESNYHQFLVAKKFGKRFSTSADYTFQSGVETLRQGVRIDTTKLIAAFDAIRFEAYERVDVQPSYGYNVGIEKTVFKKLALGGGYARIDRNYHGLNFDRFGRGNRLYASAAYAVTPDLTVSSFIGRAVGNDYAVGQRTRFDVVMSYNVLNGLKRAKLF